MIKRAVVVLGLLAVLGAAPSYAEEPKDWFAEGKAHITAGRYDAAIGAFTRALVHNPSDPYLYCWRAACHQSREDFAMALADYATGCELAPADPGPHYLRGVLLYDLKRYESAEQALTRTLQLNPRHGRAANYLGLIDLIQGRYGAAAENFTTAMVSEQEALAGQINLAMVYSLTGRLEQADQLLRDAAAGCDPGSFQFVVAAVRRYFCLLQQDQGARGRELLLDTYRTASPDGWAFPLLQCLNQDSSPEETFAAFADDDIGLTMAQAVIGLENLYSGRPAAALTHLRWAVHRGTAAPFSTIALLEYRNLVAEDSSLQDAVPAAVYFEPNPVRAGCWGRLVAEYIPFPGETALQETWSIHSTAQSSPPLERTFVVSAESHRQVIDFRIPETVAPGVYQLRLEVDRGKETTHLAGQFEVR